MAFEPAEGAMASVESIASAAPGRPPGAAKRAQPLRRLSPEKRALYEEIVALRQMIGPVEFDVVQALKELREDG